MLSRRFALPAGDKFALAEDEPGGDVLTHFGRSIADDNALGVSIAIRERKNSGVWHVAQIDA